MSANNESGSLFGLSSEAGTWGAGSRPLTPEDFRRGLALALKRDARPPDQHVYVSHYTWTIMWALRERRPDLPEFVVLFIAQMSHDLDDAIANLAEYER